MLDIRIDFNLNIGHLMVYATHVTYKMTPSLDICAFVKLITNAWLAVDIYKGKRVMGDFFAYQLSWGTISLKFAED